MIRRLPSPFILLVTVLAMLLWRGLSRDSEIEYYAPEVYVQRADALIARGYLKADCASDPMRIVTDWSDASPVDRVWYEHSYLKDDVERFNADPDNYGWTFLIDEACALIGVNPVVHTIQLPFLSRHRWLGNIYFRGRGSDVTLRSAERVLALNQPQDIVSVNETRPTAVGSGRDEAGEIILLHFGGGRRRPAGRLHYVGGKVVVHNLIETPAEGWIKLLGHRLPEGRVAWLGASDWLHLSAPNGREETFVYRGGEDFDVASAVRRRNSEHQRTTAEEPLGWVDDPSRDLPRKLLDVLADSLGTAVDALPEERASELESGFDLRLTVDRQLQSDVDRVFRGYCLAERRNRPGLTHPFGAGVTVMDGRSGEILAIATYPHPEDLEATPAAEARRRQRLLLNQNFLRHPVGSAGKPFFFAAIAAAHPFLLDLEIDPHAAEKQHRDLLQCRLPLGYQLLAGHAQRIDFERALEVSCNKYTVELATLALAAVPGAERGPLERLIPRDESVSWPRAGARSGVRIAGRELTYAPRFDEFMYRRGDLPADLETAAVQSCSAVDRLHQLPFRRFLGQVTGASTYQGEDPAVSQDTTTSQFYRSYVTERYDLRPLRPVIEYLTADAEPGAGLPVRAALQGLAPERVNLAFNHLNDLRLDYVTMLLGGGTSIWSNVQLAESLSRLVTGRKIEARLISEVVARGEEPAPAASAAEVEAIALEPRVRRPVLAGLARVVAGAAGTARALGRELQQIRTDRPDREVYLFAKTGSPRILVPVPRATTGALRGLLREGHLIVDGGRLAVRIRFDVTPYEPPGSPRRSGFAAALDAALRRVGYRSGGSVSAVLRRIADDFEDNPKNLAWPSAAEVPEAIDGPLYAAGTQLRLNDEDPLFTQRLKKEKGSVLIFSLVALPKGAGSTPVPSAEQLADPRARILTVALHLDLGPGSEVAVAAARELLPLVAGLLDSAV